jgi:hypothetical protein
VTRATFQPATSRPDLRWLEAGASLPYYGRLLTHLGRTGWTVPSNDFHERGRNEQAMIATQPRALVTETFERGRGRVMDTLISEDDLTITLVWP